MLWRGAKQLLRGQSRGVLLRETIGCLMFLLAGKMNFLLWEKSSYMIDRFASSCLLETAWKRKVYCKSMRMVGCKEESCKGNGLGWTHSWDEKLASALGYFLFSVRCSSLAVLAYQFKSRILLYPWIQVSAEQLPWACKAGYHCVLYSIV